MFRRFSTNFAIFSIFLDGLCVFGSLVASQLMRPGFNAMKYIQPITGPVGLPWILYVIFPLIWITVMLLVSAYDGRRNLRAVDEFGSVTLACFLAAISTAGVLYLTYRDVSRLLFVSFIIIAYAALLSWRVMARLLFRWEVLGTVQKRQVLIAGAGEGGQHLSRQIRSQPFLGLEVAGFLDDLPRPHTGALVLGRLDQVREVVLRQKIDDVVIACPRNEDVQINRLVAELHDLPVKVWVIPDYFSLALHRATVEDFAGIPMLDLRAPALTEYQRMVKRGFDVVVALLSMPFALPLMGFISVLIKLDSRGPVLYRQPRVGENGKMFEMIKFRTMVRGADRMRHIEEVVDSNGNVIQNKRRDDPRVTRIGSFLRRRSLDELPQLFNVLRGDMSLVGPRPELPYLVDRYELWQRKRFAVPQGMTGWWQVSGRSDKPMHLHTDEDLYYVQHYSLWLDLQILVKTIWTVLRGKGAY
jgi:exopolysaccharide biosynthesis polyprenyl glycosylphosphotransferase